MDLKDRIALSSPDDVKRLDQFYEATYAYASNRSEDEVANGDVEEA